MQTPVFEGFRLSPQQRQVWEGWRREPAVPAVEAVVSIEGELDPERLRAAWWNLVERHEILRTRFEEVPDVLYPLQVIGEPSEEAWLQQPGVGEGSPEASPVHQGPVRSLRTEESPPVRLALHSIAPGAHRLVVTASRLAADGGSIARLLAELAECYGASGPSAGAGEDPLQYADYAEWRIEQLESGGPEASPGLEFWRSVAPASAPLLDLRGLSPAARGPVASAGPVVTPGEPWSPDLAHLLRASAERLGVPLQAILASAWHVLLARRNGASGFVVLHALEPAPIEGLEGCLGPLRSLLALPVDYSASEPFAALVRRTATRLEESVRHHDAAALLRETERGHAGAWFELVEAPERQAGGCRFRLERWTAPGVSGTTGLAVLAAGDTMIPTLHGDPRTCSTRGAKRLLGELGILLEAAAGDPERPGGLLPLMDEAEAGRILVDWNATASEVRDGEGTLHGLFEAQARRTPNAAAAVFEDESLTFRNLDAWAERISSSILTQGLEPEEPVAFCLPRRLDQLGAALGVLKAGGAYAALPPTDPPERLRRTLRTSGIRTVLADSSQAEALADAPGVRVVRLDRLEGAEGSGGAPEGRAPGDPERSDRSDHLAYVLFTSGSTGTPKGVMVEHRSVLNLRHGLRRAVYERHPPTEGRPWRVGVNAPLSFDASVKQLVHLLDGHCLHLLPDAVRLDPEAFREYQRRWDLDIVDLTPSQLRPLVASGVFRSADAPRCVLVGGEPIDPELWRELCGHESTAFFNVYGPTECTVDVTVGRIDATAPEPHMGRPIDNLRVYVLDEERRPVPVGAPGEIYVAGAGLARGYLADAPRTEERFLRWEGPRGIRERLYRTGDLAHQLDDGSLVFRGRADNQVKLRGHRVELGEIEWALASLPEVQAAAVALDREADRERLVAYVVPDGEEALPPAVLREALATRLPEHLVPAAFVALESLPLTPHGKVDRAALATLDEREVRARGPYVAPASEEEQVLAGIWEEILGIDRISVEENFFDVGGHSLLAVQVHSRIQEELGAELTVIELFRHPTIRAMAEFLAGGAGEPELGTVRDRGARQRAAALQHGRAGAARRRGRHGPT